MEIRQIVAGLIIGAVGMYVATTATSYSNPETIEQEKIAAYYANSVATLVSPHNLRERMSHGKDDYVLIDVRAASDYERGHIVTAVNVDTGTGADRTTDDVLEEFRQIILENSNREIIIYCYSAACMNGRKVGNFLAEQGVYVKEMTIGFNEWRYGWEMWNYDTEWGTYKVEDFIATGTDPGVVPMEVQSIAPCGVSGELSC